MFELQLVMTGAAEAAGALLCDGVVSVGIYADDCGLNSHERVPFYFSTWCVRQRGGKRQAESSSDLWDGGVV